MKLCIDCGNTTKTVRHRYCTSCGIARRLGQINIAKQKYNSTHRIQRSIKNHERYVALSPEDKAKKKKRSSLWANANRIRLQKTRKKSSEELKTRKPRTPLYTLKPDPGGKNE